MIKSQCYINVLYHVYVVTLVGYQSMLHQIIGDFGVSDAIDEISVRGCKLAFEPAWLNENPSKSRKCPPWFGDSFASWCHVLIFFSFPGLQATDDYKNLRLVGKRYLPPIFMIKSLQFFNDGGSTSQARSRHFIRILTTVWTPEQDGDTNPEIVCYGISLLTRLSK